MNTKINLQEIIDTKPQTHFSYIVTELVKNEELREGMTMETNTTLDEIIEIEPPTFFSNIIADVVGIEEGSERRGMEIRCLNDILELLAKKYFSILRMRSDFSEHFEILKNNLNREMIYNLLKNVEELKENSSDEKE